MGRMRAAVPSDASGSDAPTIDLLIRPTGELTVKGPRTVPVFLRALRSAVRDALKRAGLRPRVRLAHRRLEVRIPVPDGGVDAARHLAREALARVFGVGSFSFVTASSRADLDEIVAMATRHARDRVRGRRYAVRCRRAGRHPFRSTDVERAVGAALNDGATVDLDDPDEVVHLQVVDRRALLHGPRIAGAGGLPVGTGGRALVLLSGGYDSVVAAWALLKRGVAVDLVHFRLAGRSDERRALQVAKLLSDRYASGSRPELHAVDFTDVVADLRRHGDDGHAQLLLKRRMLRAADAVADRLERTEAEARAAGRSRHRWARIDALVTGEALAQVSSQTLANLRALDGAAERPVLRPLLAMDKTEIIERAEAIGTAALSARVRETCGIAAGRVETRAEPRRVDDLEGALDHALLQRAVQDAVRWPLRSLRAEELTLPYLQVDRLPDRAVVLECSAGPRAAGGGPPGSVHLPVEAIAERRHELDPDRTYVTTCPFGTRSAHAAEILQQLGFDAYAFRGGTGALEAHLERRAVEAAQATAPDA